MATLEDTWGLNFADDVSIGKKLKKLLKRVRKEYSDTLSTVLANMLEFSHDKRMDFMTLDGSDVFCSLLSEDPDYTNISVTFDDKSSLLNVGQKLDLFRKHCNHLEYYECKNVEEFANNHFSKAFEKLKHILIV